MAFTALTSFPTRVSFGSASEEDFYSRKYTRPIKVKPFGIRHGFFAFDHTGKDILLGTEFLSLVAPFAFFLKGFSYTIHNPMDGKAHLFQVPWVEKHSIFGEGEKRKIKKNPIHKFDTKLGSSSNAVQKYQISFGLKSSTSYHCLTRKDGPCLIRHPHIHSCPMMKNYAE